MPYRKLSDNHAAYSVYRAGVAIDRLLDAITPEAKRQAALWAVAWCVAGGGRVPSALPLKKSRLGRRGNHLRLDAFPKELIA